MKAPAVQFDTRAGGVVHGVAVAHGKDVDFIVWAYWRPGCVLSVWWPASQGGRGCNVQADGRTDLMVTRRPRSESAAMRAARRVVATAFAAHVEQVRARLMARVGAVS